MSFYWWYRAGMCATKKCSWFNDVFILWHFHSRNYIGTTCSGLGPRWSHAHFFKNSLLEPATHGQTFLPFYIPFLQNKEMHVTLRRFCKHIIIHCNHACSWERHVVTPGVFCNFELVAVSDPQFTISLFCITVMAAAAITSYLGHLLVHIVRGQNMKCHICPGDEL